MEKLRNRKNYKPYGEWYHGHKNCKIGIETGLLDRDKNVLLSGDKICMHPDKRECIVLWDVEANCYRAFLCDSLWYGDLNPYDASCYGKCYDMNMDNGGRMDVEFLERAEKIDNYIR